MPFSWGGGLICKASFRLKKKTEFSRYIPLTGVVGHCVQNIEYIDIEYIDIEYIDIKYIDEYYMIRHGLYKHTVLNEGRVLK